ncbi:hypothetical protein PoB_000117200 [Plakobranchus ocellatus]|uniref:Uncharacterized protein n=1 Tax=Plakobranchus ocellatus TaxID=259542 RepID=A0AAV3XWZ7_9GAST|nr:hypothetical protein PoB_000117200 [Plakobranchus ocellatus]
MAAPFPLSDRASDVRPGCKTHTTSRARLARLNLNQVQRKIMSFDPLQQKDEVDPEVATFIQMESQKAELQAQDKEMYLKECPTIINIFTKTNLYEFTGVSMSKTIRKDK